MVYEQMMKEKMLVLPSLLIKNYKYLGLNETELVMILQFLSFFEDGNRFPTPEQLSAQMTLSPVECMNVIRSLMKNAFLQIETFKDSNGMVCEQYSLNLLFRKLDQWNQQNMLATVQRNIEPEKSIFVLFEEEFGRPLSPIEYETIQQWMDLDRQDPTLIQAALRESVICGKLNFRYIDRILLEWKKNGIKSVDQAKQYSLKFKERTGAFAKPQDAHMQQSSRTQGNLPFYNWLNEA